MPRVRARRQPPLGDQQVTLIRRVSAGRANRYEDGEVTVWRGCSLQLRAERTIETNDREERSSQMWDLYCPPGFHANIQDQIVVEPGPLEVDGVTPARLNLLGPSDPAISGDGRVDHVRTLVRRRIG